MLGTLLLTAQARGPQPVECTNCTDETGLIVAVSGAVLAFVALLVSFWSLYLTALRRPRIEVDHVAHGAQLRFPGWSGELPAWGADVDLRIVLANTGASGTFVESLELTDAFTCHGSGPCLFARLEKDSNHLRGGSGTPAAPPPISFERGENEPYWLVSRLHFADDVKTADDVAARLRELDAVSVTVEWSYRRGKLLRQRQRETRREHLTLRLSAERLKFEAASHWRSYLGLPPLRGCSGGSHRSRVGRSWIWRKRQLGRRGFPPPRRSRLRLDQLRAQRGHIISAPARPHGGPWSFSAARLRLAPGDAFIFCRR